MSIFCISNDDKDSLHLIDLTTHQLISSIKLDDSNYSIFVLNPIDGILILYHNTHGIIYGVGYNYQYQSLSQPIELIELPGRRIIDIALSNNEKLIHVMLVENGLISISSFDYFNKKTNILLQLSQMKVSNLKCDNFHLYWLSESGFHVLNLKTGEHRDSSIPIVDYTLDHGEIYFHTSDFIVYHSKMTNLLFQTSNYKDFIRQHCQVRLTLRPSVKKYESFTSIPREVVYHTQTNKCQPFGISSRSVQAKPLATCNPGSICLPKLLNDLSVTYVDYICQCKVSMRKHNCATFRKNPIIILTTNEIVYINEEQEEVVLITDPNILSIQVDVVSESVYWNNGSIYRLHYNPIGSDPIIEPVVTFKDPIQAFYHDPISGNLYWISKNVWITRVSAMAGMNNSLNDALTIHSMNHHQLNSKSLASLTIDLRHNYLFVSHVDLEHSSLDKVFISSIVMSWLDGTNRRVLHESYDQLSSLTTYNAECMLFFIEKSRERTTLKAVYYGQAPDLDAMAYFNQLTLTVNADFYDLTKVEIERNLLYIFNGQSQEVVIYEIANRLLQNKAVERPIREARDMAIRGYWTLDASMQEGPSRSVHSPCSDYTFRLPSSVGENSFYCACPYSKSLDSKRRSCIPSSLAVIYSVRNFGLRRIYLSNSNSLINSFNTNSNLDEDQVLEAIKLLYVSALTVPNILDSRISIETLFQYSIPISSTFYHLNDQQFSTRISHVDIHLPEERLYWVDESNPNCISRIFLNNTSENIVTCVAGQQERIKSLSIDWELNNLYFIVEARSLGKDKPPPSTRIEVIDLKYLDYDGAWFQIHKNSRLDAIFQSATSAKTNQGRDDDAKAYPRLGLPEEFLSSSDAHRKTLVENTAERDYLYTQIIVHQEEKSLYVLKTSHRRNQSIIFQCDLDVCLDGAARSQIWSGPGLVSHMSLDHMSNRMAWQLNGNLYLYDITTRTVCNVNLIVYSPEFHYNDPTLTSFNTTEAMILKKQNNNGLRFTNINYINNAVYIMDDSSAFLYRFDVSHIRFTGLKQPFPTAHSMKSIGEPILTSGCVNSASLLSLFVTHKDRQLRFTNQSLKSPHHSPFTIRRNIKSLSDQLSLDSRVDQYPAEISSLLCTNDEFSIPLNSCPGLCLGHKSRHTRNVSLAVICHCPQSQYIDTDTYHCQESKRRLLLLRSDGEILSLDPRNKDSTQFISKVKTTLEDYQYNRPIQVASVDLFNLANLYHESLVWENVYNTGAFALLALPYSDEMLSTDQSRNDNFPGSEKLKRKKNLPKNVLRLAHIRFVTGDFSLYRGGPSSVYFGDEEFSQIMENFDRIQKNNKLFMGQDECTETFERTAEKIQWPRIEDKLYKGRRRWSLTFDPINHVILWSDAKLGIIKAEDEFMSGSLGLIQAPDKTLKGQIRYPLEIAVEPVAGQIILLTGLLANENATKFTDCQFELLRLDGQERVVILDRVGDSVHSIYYSTELAQLFWIDADQSAIKSVKIMHLKAYVRNGLFPKPRDVVHGVSLDSRNLQVLNEYKSSKTINSVTDGPIIIWHDSNSSIFYSPIIDGRSMAKPKRLFPPLFESDKYFSKDLFLKSIILTGEKRKPDLSWHPCFSANEKKCSHFCRAKDLLDPKSLDRNADSLSSLYECLCPLEYELSEANPSRKSCVHRKKQGQALLKRCDSPNLICRTGLTTRPYRPFPDLKTFPTNLISANMHWLNDLQEADRHFFIRSDSRENKNSLNYTLLLSTYDGICMPNSWICDGVKDCEDNSDESGCTMCTGYQCNDGTCIQQSSHCDGIEDCDSDESCCSEDSFECSLPIWQSGYLQESRQSLEIVPSLNRIHLNSLGAKRCLKKTDSCNNVIDCPDASDESIFLCPHHFQTIPNQKRTDNINLRNASSENTAKTQSFASLFSFILKHLSAFNNESRFLLFFMTLISIILLAVFLVVYMCQCRKKRIIRKFKNELIIKKNSASQIIIQDPKNVDQESFQDSERNSSDFENARSSQHSRHSHFHKKSLNCKYSQDKSDECIYHMRPCQTHAQRFGGPPVPPPSIFQSPPNSQTNICPYRLGEDDSQGSDNDYCGYLGTRAMQLIPPTDFRGNLLKGEKPVVYRRSYRKKEQLLNPGSDDEPLDVIGSMKGSKKNSPKSMLMSTSMHDNFHDANDFCYVDNENGGINYGQYTCMNSRKYLGNHSKMPRKCYETGLQSQLRDMFVQNQKVRRKYECPLPKDAQFRSSILGGKEVHTPSFHNKRQYTYIKTSKLTSNRLKTPLYTSSSNPTPLGAISSTVKLKQASREAQKRSVYFYEGGIKNRIISDPNDLSSGDNSSTASQDRKVRKISRRRRMIKSNYSKLTNARSILDLNNNHGNDASAPAKNQSKSRVFRNYTDRMTNGNTTEDQKPAKNDSGNLKENYQSDITNPPPSPTNTVEKFQSNDFGNTNSNNTGRVGDSEKIAEEAQQKMATNDKLEAFNSAFKDEELSEGHSESSSNKKPYLALNFSPSGPRISCEGAENSDSDINLPGTSNNKICTVVPYSMPLDSSAEI